MLEMNKAWDAMQDNLLKLEKKERDHFATMVIAMARAFVPLPSAAEKARVIMLMQDDSQLALLCANATDMDALEMLNAATEHMNFVANIDRPAEGRLN